MVGSDFDDRFVTLRGPIVPAPAFMLLLDIEARGFTIRREGDTLVVRPAERLTRADCTGLRRWKWHVLMLLEYAERTDLDAHLFSDAPARPSVSTTRIA